ncbi:hypothetical protein F9C28_11045 [Shimwellia pseudoproteus]|uniref:lysozyme inhibitor LprI family protein n=1 Tax=Shimwellia pseudoproteus TaxID=570012 RepID=UPI0018EAB52C|nr:hypothetical protein [Shimwellia pseudoproteus]MBJ3815449.1 hypothetical protein [Shimwellia pseudoproteus]
MKILAVITPLLCAVSVPVMAASFDCTRARQPDELAICHDRTLNDKDVEMATTYRLLKGLFAMGARGSMQDQQQQWLAQRRQCGSDVQCLHQRYDQRLQQLTAIYDNINKPL